LEVIGRCILIRGLQATDVQISSHVGILGAALERH